MYLLGLVLWFCVQINVVELTKIKCDSFPWILIKLFFSVFCMAKFTEAEKLNILMLFLNQMWSASVLGEGQSYHQTVRHSAHLRR